jgi:hypothetical protein
VSSFLIELTEGLENAKGGPFMPVGGARLLELLKSLPTVVVERYFGFKLISLLLEVHELADWIDACLKSCREERMSSLQSDVPTAGGHELACWPKLSTWCCDGIWLGGPNFSTGAGIGIGMSWFDETLGISEARSTLWST